MGVGAAVAAFLVMSGAFLNMSPAGSPHEVERGKSAIVNVLVGFAIVLLARVIAGLDQRVTIRASRVGELRPIGGAVVISRGCLVSTAVARRSLRSVARP